MTADTSVVTIVSSTIVSLAVFGGIVKWGIAKYFSKAEELQKIKETNILSAISELKKHNADTRNKYDTIAASMRNLNSGVHQSIQNQRLILEATYDTIESVKKIYSRVEELELTVHSQNKR